MSNGESRSEERFEVERNRLGDFICLSVSELGQEVVAEIPELKRRETKKRPRGAAGRGFFTSVSKRTRGGLKG